MTSVHQIDELNIVQFENSRDEPVNVIIEPSEQSIAIPPRATLGIRFARTGNLRTTVDVQDDSISFWVDGHFETDIVERTKAAALLWKVCVVGGWCGGTADGEAVHVDDFLPSSGNISAREFAEAVIRGDGVPLDESRWADTMAWLEKEFLAAFDVPSVEAKVFTDRNPLPFEGQP